MLLYQHIFKFRRIPFAGKRELSTFGYRLDIPAAESGSAGDEPADYHTDERDAAAPDGQTDNAESTTDEDGGI